MNLITYIAWNEITGKFWDGIAFGAGLGSARYLTETELRVLRFTYENVGFSIQT